MHALVFGVPLVAAAILIPFGEVILMQMREHYQKVLHVAEEMHEQGVIMLDGFDADDAEFQATLVRVIHVEVSECDRNVHDRFID